LMRSCKVETSRNGWKRVNTVMSTSSSEIGQFRNGLNFVTGWESRSRASQVIRRAISIKEA
jgi:hypothetical protein